MKSLVITIFVLVFQASSNAQEVRVDSLVNQLNNSQVGLDGDYFGAQINLSGEPSISLFKIGKTASEKLVSVLDDSTKGVVAHIILTWIWGRTERPKTILIERDALVVYTYNELNFFVRPNEIYANQNDLDLNKIKWMLFLRQNGR